MAHFARIVGSLVTEVIVVDNSDILDADGNESEAIGRAFCTDLFGGDWVQTSYNDTIRKNYAAIGDSYNETLDAFISPSPFSSWLLNEDTCKYDPPQPFPDDGNPYYWDEENLIWVYFDPID